MDQSWQAPEFKRQNPLKKKKKASCGHMSVIPSLGRQTEGSLGLADKAV